LATQIGEQAPTRTTYQAQSARSEVRRTQQERRRPHARVRARSVNWPALVLPRASRPSVPASLVCAESECLPREAITTALDE